MTHYILDYSEWRCGDHGPYQLGGGRTMMRNQEGFSCCLGQFAEQVGVPSSLNTGATPALVAHVLGEAYDSNFVYKAVDDYLHTPLATSLMDINDDPDTTPEEKISNIRELLEEQGHTLEVINIQTS